ncbi:MAG TPA: ABC transporter ATP-binding protein [Clostridiales bacterium]|nr:ABC transporter ATP-binding protein [Clostridiales bacterium]
MARNKYDIDERLESEFNFNHLKRISRYVRPYRRKMALTLLLMIITTSASLLGPYLIKEALDTKIPEKDVAGLVVLSAFFTLNLAIIAVCSRFRIELINDVGQSIMRDIRLDLFSHLQELPFSYYDSRPHGKIYVRVINYVNSIGNLLSNGLIQVIIDLISLVFIIVIMFSINARLMLLSLTGLPVLLLTVFLIKNMQRKAWQDVSAKQSNMNAYIHESISGIKVTQAYVRESVNLGILEDLGNKYRDSWMKAVNSSFILGPVVDNISTIVTALIYMAGVSWIAGGVSLGVLIAFTSYTGRFWGPINNLSNFYNQIVTVMAYLERVFETMDEKPTVADLPGAYEMPSITGKIEFKNVDFSYEEGGRRILNNVSFTANPGESIALVGPTGAGKTTVVNLISRFYNINSGEILIDGINIQDVTLKSLRKQMGIMLQDTFIFSGNIIDNIKYGKLDADDEEVIEAAKAVMAHDFIVEMNGGYYAEVSERGSTLSAGQRQLISFARTLLADPKILILDEATSSIDTKTEIALQQGLEKLLQGRTSFIIAHRLSTIKNASRIMYIDNGEIVEQGTHDELIAKRGAYWELYTEQYKHLAGNEAG